MTATVILLRSGVSMQSDEPIALADMTVRRATRREQAVAAAFVAAFAGFTFAASRLGTIQGATVGAFVPICATLWCGAELLTSFLLFTQFAVNGVRAFAYFGAAYALAGLLTIPYIAYYPGVFVNPSPANGTEQISSWIWLGWHVVFPVVISAYRLYDPDFNRRFLSGARIRTGIRFALTSVVAGAAIGVVLVVLFKDSLPSLVIGGRFTSVWSHVFSPLVFVLNAAAAMLVIGLVRRPSLLQLWLAVALATSAVNGALNAFGGAPYTLSWYLGMVETLTAACVLLLMLLSQVGALYRQARHDGDPRSAHRSSQSPLVR